MLSAKSITFPFICEQTKYFGSEGTINYNDASMDCSYQLGSFSQSDSMRKIFLSINETSKKIFTFKIRGIFSL